MEYINMYVHNYDASIAIFNKHLWGWNSISHNVHHALYNGDNAICILDLILCI